MTKNSLIASPVLPLRSADKDDDINLLSLFRVLWRGKLWILSAMILCIVMAGYYAYKVAEPKFRATSTVIFSPEQNGILDLENIVTGNSADTASFNTEIAIILSRETLEELAQSLNLTEEPEFNPALVVDTDAFSLRKLAKDLLGLTEDPVALTPEQQEAQTLRRTTENLWRALKVDIQTDTYLFNITATSTDAVRAAEIANTLAEIHIENQRTKKFADTEQAIDWLSARVRELEVGLRQREDEIRTLQSETDLINRDVLERLSLQAKEFRDRLQDRNTLLSEGRARLTLLEQAADSGDREQILALFDDATLRRLDASTDANARAAFDIRVQTLLSEKRGDITRLERETEALAASRDRLESEIAAQSKDLQTLEQMQRELDVTRDLYQTFLTGLQEVTVQVGLVRADTSLMSRALPPLRPVSPNRKLIIAAAAFMGALLAAGALLVREAMNDTVRSGEELEALTGLPLLGQVPRIPARRRPDVVRYLREKPTSAAVEAVRNLRTSLLLSNVEVSPQVILLTSSIPGEGKTTMAVALAINLAGLGKRVLLVEGDIRRCTLSTYFETGPDTHDMQDVLNGDMSLSEAVFHDEVNGIDVLLGRTTSVNPADVLSSERFRAMLEEARAHYDHIILDTPPVLVVPDARILVQLSDVLLFVVRWDSTKRDQVADGLRHFEASGQKVTGIALSQVDPKGLKRYGYGTGYGSYGLYGKGYYSES